MKNLIFNDFIMEVNKMYSYDPVRDDNGWATKFD